MRLTAAQLCPQALCKARARVDTDNPPPPPPPPPPLMFLLSFCLPNVLGRPCWRPLRHSQHTLPPPPTHKPAHAHILIYIHTHTLLHTHTHTHGWGGRVGDRLHVETEPGRLLSVRLSSPLSSLQNNRPFVHTLQAFTFQGLGS